MTRRETFPLALAASFEPIRRIASGGFGDVYLARDRRLGRPVAVKVLRSPEAPEALQRVLREAEVLGRLRHPNIVSIFDSGQIEGCPYIVMEYLAGQTLQEVGVLEDPLEAMEQVADGLQAIHAAGLVHRDLKPGNLIRTVGGRMVIVDLGLVWVRDRTRITRDAAVLGTLAYLAPECLRGDPPSFASDWFAWGVVLHELLEGCPPFCLEELQTAASGGALPEPRWKKLDPTSSLAATLRALLVAEPSDRPSDRARILELLRGKVPADGSMVVAPGRKGADPVQGARGRSPFRVGRPVLIGTLLAVVSLLLCFRARFTLVPALPPESGRPDLEARIREALESAEGKTLEQALERMVRDHRRPDGELDLALRGGSFLDHQAEVVREFLDPRCPIRWRRLFQALEAWERSLPASLDFPRVRDLVVIRRLLPALIHLGHDKGLAFSFGQVRTLSGSLDRISLGEWSQQDLEKLQEHLEEVAREAREGIQRIGFLALPSTPESEAFQALLVGLFTRQDSAVTLERVLTRLDSTPSLEADTRLLLVQAALILVPNSVTRDPIPCDLRLRSVQRARDMLRPSPGTLTEEQRVWLASSGLMALLNSEAACPIGEEQAEEIFREFLRELERAGARHRALVETYLTWIGELDIVLAFTVSQSDPLSGRLRRVGTCLERIREAAPAGKP